MFPITIPPLLERREDILALVSALVSESGTALGKDIESVAKESMDALRRYHWPGNVRELRNVIERAMIVAKGPKLRIQAQSTSSQVTGFFRNGDVDQTQLSGATAGAETATTLYFTRAQLATNPSPTSSYRNLIDVVNPGSQNVAITLDPFGVTKQAAQLSRYPEAAGCRRPCLNT